MGGTEAALSHGHILGAGRSRTGSPPTHGRGCLLACMLQLHPKPWDDAVRGKGGVRRDPSWLSSIARSTRNPPAPNLLPCRRLLVVVVGLLLPPGRRVAASELIPTTRWPAGVMMPRVREVIDTPQQERKGPSRLLPDACPLDLPFASPPAVDESKPRRPPAARGSERKKKARTGVDRVMWTLPTQSLGSHGHRIRSGMREPTGPRSRKGQEGACAGPPRRETGPCKATIAHAETGGASQGKARLTGLRSEPGGYPKVNTDCACVRVSKPAARVRGVFRGPFCRSELGHHGFFGGVIRSTCCDWSGNQSNRSTPVVMDWIASWFLILFGGVSITHKHA